MNARIGDLAGRGPLGQRAGKGKTRRDPKTATERKHMAAVAALPCLVCGSRPVEIHHEGKPRSNMNVLPLCPSHHRREYGPGALHHSPRAFYEAHGTTDQLLARVEKMLAEYDDTILGDWF
ncbi:DUF968 domain-containing protein [Paracoccus sp. PAR01]|uniref:DUF968 domain-containing protein n=1 Tax=Paracoccus sp. PAR01 TaxID=2769282 RepID=UPI00177FB1A2|nr:DUF968 domain-containing protein [Paracoccus sp. PAR01]MBD9529016.1 DUF968 domain-containing protein [Paracoccus sp. PAR01]